MGHDEEEEVRIKVGKIVVVSGTDTDGLLAAFQNHVSAITTSSIVKVTSYDAPWYMGFIALSG